MPYSVPRFNYLATYWVKHKPSLLGLLVNDLNDEQREQLNSNKGIAVLTVIKDSPAYRADFFICVILIKIGDIDLYDVKSFQSALQKYEGQKVNIIFMRDGKEIEKEIQLNSKPE
jgi:S1-C subfamily serine protease